MIGNFIFLAIIIAAIYTRIQNTCECNEDKEIKFDVLQIVLVGILSFYLIDIAELIKFVGIILASYIIKSVIKFALRPRITYKKGNECDCKSGFKF